jgi:hypothetical protein
MKEGRRRIRLKLAGELEKIKAEPPAATGRFSVFRLAALGGSILGAHIF